MREIKVNKRTRRILLVLFGGGLGALIVLGVIATTGPVSLQQGNSPGVVVTGDNTYVIDTGSDVVIDVDPTPVIDAPDVEGQEYIEQEDGTITIIRK